MPTAVLCKICGRRRARRACPAVEGDICTICCGEEREVSLTCPFTCEHLREAHRHEKSHWRDRAREPGVELPYAEIDTGEIEDQRDGIAICAYALFEAAAHTPGAVDRDALEALDAEIRTRRTAQSGLVYATKPENMVAQTVQRRFVELLDELEKQSAERESFPSSRSSELLGTLVFLYRLGVDTENGRVRGRAFLAFLGQIVEPVFTQDKAGSDLIVSPGGGLLL